MGTEFGPGASALWSQEFKSAVSSMLLAPGADMLNPPNEAPGARSVDESLLHQVMDMTPSTKPIESAQPAGVALTVIEETVLGLRAMLNWSTKFELPAGSLLKMV
jgi:hypothetical protein